MAVTGFPAFHSHSHAIESLSSPNFTGAVVGHAPKSLVPDPYVRAVHPIPAGKLLKNFSVTTSNLPDLSQKHGELLKDEGQYKLLLQKKTLTDGEVYNLQCLAFNIHRVYGLGMYDCSSLAVVPSDLQKSVDVVLRAIRRIEEDPRISNDRIFPQLRYSLAKMMMMCAQQLPEGCEEAGSLREAAMVHYQSSNTFSGSAFALLVEAFSGDLTKPDILKQFRDRVAALHFSKEEQSYYAGKYFKGLAAASEGNKGLQKTYRGLSTEYFKAARGSGFYWGEKANAYMAQEFMSEAREMYTGAGSLAPGSEGFLEKVLGKIREAFQLIFGSGIGNIFGSGNQVYVTPNKKLGADSYAVLADGYALAYAIIEGPDPDIKKDALRYQEAANALGKPSHRLQVDQEYHLDLIAKATPELLDAMARMQYESPEINTALVKRAAANIPQSKEVLLLLIGQGKVHLEEIAAVDNLPPDVMSALLRAAATAGTLTEVCQKLIGDEDSHTLSRITEIARCKDLPAGTPTILLDAAKRCPHALKQDLLFAADTGDKVHEDPALVLIAQGDPEVVAGVAARSDLSEEAMDALLGAIEQDPKGLSSAALALIAQGDPEVLDRLSELGGHPEFVAKPLGEAVLSVVASMEYLLHQERKRLGKTAGEMFDLDLLIEMMKHLDDFSSRQLRHAVFYLEKKEIGHVPSLASLTNMEGRIEGLLLGDGSFAESILYKSSGAREMRSGEEIIERIHKFEEVFVCRRKTVGRELYTRPNGIRDMVNRRLVRGYQGVSVSSSKYQQVIVALQKVSEHLYSAEQTGTEFPMESGFEAWRVGVCGVVSFLHNGKYHSVEEGFFAALEEGQFQIAEFLIQTGVIDVNFRDEESGRTALSKASGKGGLDQVKFLIHYGADANAVDKQGLAALSHAIECRNIEIVQFLVNEGKSDIHAPTVPGCTDANPGVRRRTALGYACDQGKRGRQIAAFLRSKGAVNEELPGHFEGAHHLPN